QGSSDQGHAAGPARRRSGPPPPQAEETTEIVAKLEHYLAVAKGEITRLDYIVTQFLQAMRPTPAQKKPVSLNDIARETIDLLRTARGVGGPFRWLCC